MATAKKSTTKKPATKVTTKKAVKKTPKTKNLLAQSFRRVPEQESFFTFRITQQSIYWLILALVILGLSLWVIKLHIEVQDILDRIDQNEAISSSFIEPIAKSE